MQQTLSQGVSGQLSTQPDRNIISSTVSMQAGASGSLQSSLAPGVYIYGQTQGASSAFPGQPAGTHGSTLATNSIYTDQVNWNANHMYYQQKV